MTSFKIENVWICELVCVYRRETDNMLTLHESNSKCVLIMKEEARPPANVVHIKGQDYLLEQKAYFDLEGRESIIMVHKKEYLLAQILERYL